MTIIGITGGTGAGKTTVLRQLEKRGALVIDCDEIYHALLLTSDEMKREIGLRFPGAVQNGAVDRKALGRIVFASKDALRDLNAITHQHVGMEVRRRIRAWEKKGGKLVAIDAIALIESGLGNGCDIVIGVTAPEDVRLRRIMERESIPRDYAKLRITAQKPDRFFAKNCDYILKNDSTSLEGFISRINDLLDQLLGGTEHGDKG